MNDLILRALNGIYFDAPADGGGKMNIEEITNKKLAGEEPPADPPTAPDTGEGDGDREPPANPSTPKNPEIDDEGGDSDGGEPAEPDTDGGDDDGGGEPSASPEEDFFDPEKHVKGKPAHSNKFKTREQAEYAAIAKADLLKTTLNEMKEDGVSPGAIPLPKALQNNLESIDQFTQLEIVHAMDDDELRSFLNETDATRQRFNEKHTRIKNEKDLRKAKNRYEEVQVQLYDDLAKVMSVEDIQANINKIGNKETAKPFIEKAINDKIKDELKPLRDELEEWIDEVDNGSLNLSIKEFDKQKQDKVSAIERKAQELKEEYSGGIERIDELYELYDKVGSAQAQSPEAIRENMFNAFDEFQNDRSGIMAILDDTPTAKAELVAAKKFAIQNKEKYNNLQKPNDWVQAIEKGWAEHKANIRAENQRKKIQGDGKKTGDDGDIPKPGDQSKITSNFSTDSVHSSNKRSLDKLVELTNSRI